ncbi:MAG: 4Fe-4S dicluster domain-containing protein [Chloroflexi bacterium]|nr:4Fe-4S dicluster domain-containing protein [Chloroflexota bacterium]
MDDATYDPNFKYDVALQPGAEQIKVCYACGTCTAGCPVAEVEERFSPRRIIRQILLGQREAVLSSELLWYCETCYTCSAYCPQNVKFGDVMRALREMAVAEGYFPAHCAERIRQVDRLAHAARLEFVRAALTSTETPLSSALEKALEAIAAQIKALEGAS